VELLELNYMGFTGKPLSTNLKDPESQIWGGLAPNG
jgi:hypothetical protein